MDEEVKYSTRKQSLNNSLEIVLRLFNIHELLQAPGIRNRKRLISGDAEEFIVEEAEALPHKGVININIHLALAEKKYQEEIAPAIQSHFCYRRLQSKKRLKANFQHGWRTLLIALLLLAIIFSITEIVLNLITENKFVTFIRESFIILGWVALWRPMELLLYDWYPINREVVLFRRLEKSNVQVIIEES
ncbi:MAG TPA: hypothetical protein VFD56_00785 [Chitinophagaceae bacterium]|nr:hypothetical protein [Chitinophagaceae bacterium]